MAKKIYLSPSNQYDNLYSYGSTNEMNQCNKIATAAETALKRNGYEVKRAPKGQNMNTSISESNNWGADIHIPIHTNAGGGKGPLVMVYNTSAANLKYAQPVYDALKAISPQGGGYGVRLDSDVCGYTLDEIQDTAAKCVYIEAEFHDSSSLAKWIINNTDKIGEAICKGICKADGKTYKAPEQPKPAEDAYIHKVQIGAFKDPKNAQKLEKELEKKGYADAFVVKVKK